MLQDNTTVHKSSKVRLILEEFDQMVSELRANWFDEWEARARATSIQRDKYANSQ